MSYRPFLIAHKIGHISHFDDHKKKELNNFFL